MKCRRQRDLRQSDDASITQIRVEPDGRFRVISVGDTGHIPPNLLTGAIGMSEKSLTVPK